ncbi:MAG: hypothetical protein GX295_08015 [Syntrophomonadaceae bacterium]|nr:hypothetical protein [Syntrophomonadaceae bacterium]
MISLELAQKLKAAGLKWLPQKGDYFTFEPEIVPKSPGKSMTITITSGTHCLNNMCKVGRYTRFNPPNSIWLPDLEQLQTEIATRGGQVRLEPITGREPVKYQCTLRYENQEKDHFTGLEPEEAVGQALLWLLQQECN